ncbi:MAG: 3-phosphoshikimate 1-carboxyvinyltransferase [Methanophagales archaeon]|nr:3-phosphoshikimate 1-carboxyvinyltransferase [Methanophagales archaeon]
MTTARVRRSKVEGEMIAPPSKSYTHRAITIASLAKRSEIVYPLLAADTEASINAARYFGATVSVEHDGDGREHAKKIIVEGTEGSPDTPEDVINAGNSGTTLRFFTAVSSLCRGGEAAVITGDESLRKRPNLPLLKSLIDLGCSEAFSTKGDGTAPIVVKGRLSGGETTIDTFISSQFISALLIATPLAAKDSYILAQNLSSVPYMRMTVEVLKQAGVDIDIDLEASNDYSFHVEGGGSYDLRRFAVPGDFSSASYPLAAAAITDSKLKVRNLFSSAQGDSRIVELLAEMGVSISWEKEKGVVEVKGTEDTGLKAIKVNMRENPDLVPTIAVLAAVADGTTEITGVAHLRYKETNRLRSLAEELTKMGVRIKERKDGLLVEGRSKKGLKAVKVYSHDDHRLAMALTVAALSVRGRGESERVTVIEGAGCANISYPSFFTDMRDSGAEIAIS